ncbi:MAG: hydantoinase/oxoprolinase family protein, partial [Desulfovibrio sp.]|nr:hydantoinase/oxoprolinase family protein [Desulfovibrio sp.]
MSANILLGIDAGGTHTDAVIIVEENGVFKAKAEAKVPTQHDDLEAAIREVLGRLKESASDLLPKVTSVTLGTTLAVNALVQGATEKVGLLLSAGPGLAPARFALGDYVETVEGGLDHRGVEVTRLSLKKVDTTLSAWKKAGLKQLACVSKFSPRNAAHEEALAKLGEAQGFTVTMGHRLSGQLNFPRRIATAFFNAAVDKIHFNFTEAVAKALKDYMITAPIRLLKADGGAVPLELSRKEPVQSILSGPAASVMGVLALCQEAYQGVSLLLDVGGTTTDLAVIIDGSPVIDRDGMVLEGRRTLVRALASISIGVGGDSQIKVSGQGDEALVCTGPTRIGNAMAFGGPSPTLLDALNYLDFDLPKDTGDLEKSKAGLVELAKTYQLAPEILAKQAVESAIEQIKAAADKLLQQINERPIYTLRALRAHSNVSPAQIILVGGPALCLKTRLKEAFGLKVIIPAKSEVANAVGAALTKPTASLEVYADTGTRSLKAPKLAINEKLEKNATL